MDEVLAILGMLLAVYGMATLVHTVAERWLLPKQSALWVIPVSGHRTDAEYLIRAAEFAQHRSPIVLLDCGLTPESAQLAREVCERLHVNYATQKDWEKITKTALQEEKRGV